MLRLNGEGCRDFTVGEMVNLMTVDVQKCNDLLVHLNILWSGPFQIIVSLGFLYNLMGWSVIAGFVVLLLLLPLSVYFSTKEKFIDSKQMVHKDSRSKLMNEILAGIKILKVYAWEESFIAKVMGYRKKELTQLKNAMYLRACHEFIVNVTPMFVSCATFALYVLTGNELTAKKAFVALTLFNIIRFPIIIMPLVISSTVQYIVSAKRLSNFLKGDELILTDVTDIGKDSENGIEVVNGTFIWTAVDEPVLQNINFKVPQGSLTGVVGKVGTGKSSLLSSVLGEIKKVNGEVFKKGSVAYVSQEAWIQNSTLRDNVLFGKRYNKAHYNRVIQACALETDLNILPGGDMTEIGEKGVNISGGQKQRISLARAVYNNADIYLLDDPISAVDANVAKHIFDHVVGAGGLLKNKVKPLMLTFWF